MRKYQASWPWKQTRGRLYQLNDLWITGTRLNSFHTLSFLVRKLISTTITRDHFICVDATTIWQDLSWYDSPAWDWKTLISLAQRSPHTFLMRMRNFCRGIPFPIPFTAWNVGRDVLKVLSLGKTVTRTFSKSIVRSVN